MPTNQTMSALVVDDNKIVCAVIKKILERHGVATDVVYDGISAREKLAKTKQLDAIFLDLFLPGIPGWELLDFIEATPELSNVPVVIISNAPLTDEMRADIEGRVHSFLNKDYFDRDTFEALIADLLNISSDG